MWGVLVVSERVGAGRCVIGQPEGGRQQSRAGGSRGRSEEGQRAAEQGQEEEQGGEERGEAGERQGREGNQLEGTRGVWGFPWWSLRGLEPTLTGAGGWLVLQVHCWAGESRSVSVLAAYMIKHEPALLRNPRDLAKQQAALAAAEAEGAGQGQGAGMGRLMEADEDGSRFGLAAALQRIRRAQPRANPNPGFTQQLHWYAAMLSANRSRRAAAALDYRLFQYQAVREINGALSIETVDLIRNAGGDEVGAETRYRCKSCRRTLCTSDSVLEHSPGDGQQSFGWYRPAPHNMDYPPTRWP